MLESKIKASSVKSLEDARYFSSKGVEWMSFEHSVDHPEYLSASEVKAIGDWLEGPQLVLGFMKGENDFYIEAAVNQLEAPALEIDIDSVVDLSDFLLENKHVFVRAPFSAIEALPDNVHIVLDMENHSDTALIAFLKDNADEIEGKSRKKDIYLRANWTKASIVLAKEIAPSLGIDISKGSEVLQDPNFNTSYHSFDAVDELFDVLEDWSEK